MQQAPTTSSFGLRYRVVAPSHTTDLYICHGDGSYSNQTLLRQAKAKAQAYSWEQALQAAQKLYTYLGQTIGYRQYEIQICRLPSWRIAKRFREKAMHTYQAAHNIEVRLHLKFLQRYQLRRNDERPAISATYLGIRWHKADNLFPSTGYYFYFEEHPAAHHWLPCTSLELPRVQNPHCVYRITPMAESRFAWQQQGDRFIATYGAITFSILKTQARQFHWEGLGHQSNESYSCVSEAQTACEAFFFAKLQTAFQELPI